jgi:hypothetical protein
VGAAPVGRLMGSWEALVRARGQNRWVVVRVGASVAEAAMTQRTVRVRDKGCWPTLATPRDKAARYRAIPEFQLSSTAAATWSRGRTAPLGCVRK